MRLVKALPLRELARQLSKSSAQNQFAGTPEQLADHIIAWQDAGAVDGFTTWMPAGCLVTTVAPSGLVTELTMRGGMRTPLFAIVWYIPAICSTVIDTPCPNGTFANVEADQSDEPGTGT